MAKLLDDMPACQSLAQLAKDFHARGWMAGTAGNLSRRDDAHSFWITASGKPKGQLQENDFVRVDISSGEMIESAGLNNKPSAETCIHQVIYSLFPDANACLHVHTVDAYLATRKHAQENFLPLPNIEMIKGFDIWQQTPNVSMAVFENTLHVPQIAEEIKKTFQQQLPDISALMIRDHGVTVWGNSLQQAYNRLEISEFIMSFLARS